MAPPRQSKRRCSSPTGSCLGVFETPGSPWRRWSGSTMPEVLCLFGGSHSSLRHDCRQGPWAGMVTAPEPPTPLEVQRRVAQAIERATYSWPSSRMLPMLPNAGMKKFVSCPSSRQVQFAFCHGKIFSGLTSVRYCCCNCNAPTLFRPRHLSRRRRSTTRIKRWRRGSVLCVRRSIRNAKSPRRSQRRQQQEAQGGEAGRFLRRGSVARAIVER
jgi:hypothetical protein